MDDNELKKIDTQFAAAAGATAIILGTGVVFYHFIENLSLIDALYFSVITLTTVGYGDISPETDIGKLFTVMYIIAGIAILGTFANLLLKRTVAHTVGLTINVRALVRAATSFDQPRYLTLS